MCNGECEFKTVIYQGKEYPDLEVSMCGIMRNRNSGNIYAWTSCGTRYLCAMYGMGKGHKKRMKQHRVLMETFVPNPENKPHINHIDSNRMNNRLSNLEWCTAKENSNHAINAGRMNHIFGENNGLSKLTEENVIFIRKNYVEGDVNLGQKALAKKFGVTPWTIRQVVNYKSWKHIGENYGKDE